VASPPAAPPLQILLTGCAGRPREAFVRGVTGWTGGCGTL